MMPDPTETPMVDEPSAYKEKIGSAICEPNDRSDIIDPCQLFNGLLKDFRVIKERMSKIPLNKESDNRTTSTAENTKAFEHTRKSGNELPAAIATAFEKLNLTAQEESEGEPAFEQESGFEMVEKDEAMGDEDDMVVVEEPEEEDDYVEV